jgi:hypothetical protein
MKLTIWRHFIILYFQVHNLNAKCASKSETIITAQTTSQETDTTTTTTLKKESTLKTVLTSTKNWNLDPEKNETNWYSTKTTTGETWHRDETTTDTTTTRYWDETTPDTTKTWYWGESKTAQNLHSTKTTTYNWNWDETTSDANWYWEETTTYNWYWDEYIYTTRYETSTTTTISCPNSCWCGHSYDYNSYTYCGCDCSFSVLQTPHISLTWGKLADLDLYVVDPSGETIFYSQQYSSSGGTYSPDMRTGPNAVEFIS